MITEWLNEQVNKRVSPVQRVGIAGFMTSSIVDETIDYRARSTITYLEDGTHVNEHIINEPTTITINGVVGDVYKNKEAIEELLNRVNGPLGRITNYMPYQTKAMIQKANAGVSYIRDYARKADDIINSGKAVLDFGDKSSGVSLQQQFMQQIKTLHETKQPVTIDTIGQQFKNMVLTSISFFTDATSPEIKYAISAQQLRFVDNLFSASDDAFSKLKPSSASKEFASKAKSKAVAVGGNLSNAVKGKLAVMGF
jgi:hypothetical protein